MLFRTLAADMRRVLLSRAFIGAALSGAVCLMAAAFGFITETGWLRFGAFPAGFACEVSLSALSGNVMLLVLPILATIPYSASVTDDVKSGYLRQFLPRTTVGAYLWSKAAACAAAGALALMAGILLGCGALSAVLAFFPVQTGQAAQGFSRLFPYIGLYALSAAAWAALGLMLSSTSLDRTTAYAAPFIIYFVLIILSTRYIRSAHFIDPRSWLSPEYGLAALAPAAILLASALLLRLTVPKKLTGDGRAAREAREPRRSRPSSRRAASRDERPSARAVQQAFCIAGCNFRRWRGNGRVRLTFLLALVLCFLLSDKAASFAYLMDTSMQAFEPFIWTFGDADSVLLTSLLLVLLFADMPFLGADTPFYISRTGRRVWLWGQAIYVAAATAIYMCFVFTVTAVICMGNSFIGNMWSETAAILAYTGAWQEVALPALLKTLEMSHPYQCAAAIFLPMLLYTLMSVFLMLLFSIRRGPRAGIAAVLGFNLYGFLLKPDTLIGALALEPEMHYAANVTMGWLSPLNHATYHMHNFGFDLLPRLWQSCLLFAFAAAVLFALTLRAVKSYNFTFLGGDT